MKKWIVRISLLLTLTGSVLELARFYQRMNPRIPPVDAFAWINLGLFIFLSLIALAAAAVTIWSFTAANFQEQIDRILERKAWYRGISVFLVLLFYEAIQDLLYFQAGLKEIYYPVVLLENRDLIIWAAFISGQMLLAWLVLGWRAHVLILPSWRKIPLWFLAGLVISAVVFLAAGRSGLPPNAPLPFLHVFLVVLLITLVWLFLRWIQSRFPRSARVLQNDFLALIVLWAAAFLLWSNVPLQTNYFIDQPRPPNFEYSPTSDAIYYETMAQRLLVGEGFDEKAHHPLYSYLLGGLHWIGGGHYLDIYKLQIALLSLIPFLVYLLAKVLDSRFAGWLLAALVIIREYNALQLGDSITVSNVQELMSEPLATLGVILFLYLTVLWVKDGRGKWGGAVLIGAVIGAIALIRVELLSLAFVFGLTAVAVNLRSYRRWLVAGILSAAALGVVLTPWVIRNYQRTGQITIDKGVVFSRTVKSLANQSQALDEGVTGQTDRSFTENVVRQIKGTGKHAIASLEQTLIYLPNNHFPLGGADTFVKIVPDKGKVYLFQPGIFSDEYLSRYVKSLPYWEVRWDGDLTPRSILPQLLVVGLVLIGLQRAYQRNRLAGFVPLLAMVAHILVYAIVRGSGGRFIQVVDWITLLYLGFGLTALVGKVFRVDFQAVPPALPGASQNDWSGLAWAGLILVLVISMPVLETSIPKRYTEALLNESKQEAVAESGADQVLPDQPGAECQLGKALYPGFYAAGESFSDDRAGGMPDTDRAQMVFYLVGTRNTWVSLPSLEPLSPFPHGAEILVCGQVVRDTPEDLELNLRPYFLAEQVYFLDRVE